MADNPQIPKKSITPDWLVQGTLTRIGDTLDRLTGRHWRPSSSLATSGLIERMKMLLDREAKENEEGQKFVPHNIKLKMQWDKFSTDSEENIRKLEYELLTAAVDHISDNRYYTYAPIKLEVKPDYFTEGVKLFVSFDKFHDTGHEAELNVTVPAAKVADLIPEEMRSGLTTTPPAEAAGPPPKQGGELFVRFRLGTDPAERRFEVQPGHRLSIGRTKENDIAIDHTSVSKHHASLVLNEDGKLLVADTGSTNGTYLNGERIAYGKASEVFAGDKVKFGAIEVELEFRSHEVPPDAPTEAYTVGDIPSAKKIMTVEPAVKTETEEEVP